MTTPDFILKLRAKVGHDPLWLSGITAYVEDDRGRILLGQRADSGEWAPVYGIVEPGEQPAYTCIREAKEETGVDIEPVHLARVMAVPRPVVYDNGDVTRYLDVEFYCRVKPGGNSEPFVGDDESLKVGWFEPDALPQPLARSAKERLAFFRGFKERLAAGDASATFSAEAPENV